MNEDFFYSRICPIRIEEAKREITVVEPKGNDDDDGEEKKSDSSSLALFVVALFGEVLALVVLGTSLHWLIGFRGMKGSTGGICRHSLFAVIAFVLTAQSGLIKGIMGIKFSSDERKVLVADSVSRIAGIVFVIASFCEIYTIDPKNKSPDFGVHQIVSYVSLVFILSSAVITVIKASSKKNRFPFIISRDLIDATNHLSVLLVLVAVVTGLANHSSVIFDPEAYGLSGGAFPKIREGEKTVFTVALAFMMLLYLVSDAAARLANHRAVEH